MGEREREIEIGLVVLRCKRKVNESERERDRFLNVTEKYLSKVFTWTNMRVRVR